MSFLPVLSFLSDLVLTKLNVFLFPFSSRRCYCHGATKWHHQLALSWHHHQSVKSQKHKSEKMTHVLGCWIICYKMSIYFFISAHNGWIHCAIDNIFPLWPLFSSVFLLREFREFQTRLLFFYPARNNWVLFIPLLTIPRRIYFSSSIISWTMFPSKNICLTDRKRRLLYKLLASSSSSFSSHTPPSFFHWNKRAEV